MSVRLAIVIVNFNARDWLEQCLRAIGEQDLVEELEIVVVDWGTDLVRQNGAWNDSKARRYTR